MNICKIADMECEVAIDTMGGGGMHFIYLFVHLIDIRLLNDQNNTLAVKMESY